MKHRQMKRDCIPLMNASCIVSVRFGSPVTELTQKPVTKNLSFWKNGFTSASQGSTDTKHMHFLNMYCILIITAFHDVLADGRCYKIDQNVQLVRVGGLKCGDEISKYMELIFPESRTELGGGSTSNRTGRRIRSIARPANCSILLLVLACWVLFKHSSVQSDMTVEPRT